MQGTEIFLPVMVHMLLVVSLFFLLAKRKIKASKESGFKRESTALDNKAWTDDVVKVSNNIANQFETPILFYVICVVAFLTGIADMVSITLAWAYVAVRFFHAYVHIGSNYVPTRMKVFAFSLLILLALVIRIILTILV